MSDHQRVRVIIREIIESAWPAVLTTVDRHGMPFTRAMSNLHNKDEVNFSQSAFFSSQEEWTYFFRTHKNSAKVRQTLSTGKANAYYAIPREMFGLTLLGTIVEFDDAKAKEALWVAEWENDYAYGMSDPDFTLLKFEAVEFRLFTPIDDEFRQINMKIKELEGEH